MKMRRKIISLFLCLTLLLGVCTVAASAAADADTRLEVVRVLGIMVGDTHGNLNLDKPVTRAEFTKMMVAASAYKDSVTNGSGASLFTDVKTGHWAGGYISAAVTSGWMVGYIDGSFRPDRSITLEEGCTALLRVLGYDNSSFAGSYPSAQLTKAQSVGLRDDMTCQRGHVLTRQDCVTLFYNLLLSKTKQEQIYGATLGYTIKNGEIDYSALISGETKGPYVAEKGAVVLPFGTENVTVYRNGVPSELSKVAADDVYYYHQNLRTVWVYTERITGVLTTISPNAVAPTAVTVEGKSYSLGTSAATYQVSAQGSFKEGDTVTLLFGMDNAVVKVLAADVQQELYYGMDLASTEGPFVASAGALELPFDGNVTVYRNGVRSDQKQVAFNDVYYYHQGLQTVWVYNDRAAGTLTAISPNRYAPTAVTVAGVTYTLGTTEAVNQVSAQGAFRTGDTVVLLLAVDGTVVKILSAAEGEQIHYGVVLSSHRESASEETASSATGMQVATQVVTADATILTFYHTGGEFTVGATVCAVVNADGTKVTSAERTKLSGAVSATGSIGSYKLAQDVKILDTDGVGGYVVVYPQRLTGSTLAEKHVLHYALNDAGEISSMILYQATGDTWDYAFVTDYSVRNNSSNVSASYTYIMDGKTQTISGNTQYPVQRGGALIKYEEGRISGMYSLGAAKLTYLTEQTAVSGSRSFKFAEEELQVVLRDSVDMTKYYATTLSQVNTAEYNLTGWFDDQGCPAGGRLRVIVAEPK